MMSPDSSAVARSAVTNGSRFLAGVDGRSTWARRARDIVAQLIEDRGGEDRISEAEQLILRRAAVLAVEAERLETQFALAGKASEREDLDLYQRISNSMRRLLESVGLDRVARDVTPSVSDWIEQQGDQP